MQGLGSGWGARGLAEVGAEQVPGYLWQAEEFHTLVHSFLGRLSESEKTLKYGVFPEEELAVQECQNQLQVSACSCQPPLPPTSPHLQGGSILAPGRPVAGLSQPLLGCGVRHTKTWDVGPHHTKTRGLEP